MERHSPSQAVCLAACATLAYAVVRISSRSNRGGEQSSETEQDADTKASGEGSKGSVRICATDAPCIVTMQNLMKGSSDVSKLSQGIVHWKPPKESLERARKALTTDEIHGYGNDEGSAELRGAIKRKLARENGIKNSEVMVTCGANQAFANVILSLADHSDAVVLFPPYYFNHLMAVQMTGGFHTVEMGKTDPKTMEPSAEWLERRLAQQQRSPPSSPSLSPPSPKITVPGKRGRVAAVVLSNPCNPTGVVTDGKVLARISRACEKAGVWLILDNTYEYFTYNKHCPHVCLEAPHIVNIFSFSKAFGMMGWRVGYIAYHRSLRNSLLKAQDTIPICPTQISEKMALGALEAGREWVLSKLPSLVRNRDLLLEALKPLRVIGGQGAIYLFVELPEKYRNHDMKVVKWVANTHKVGLIPGSSCGAPGYVRVAFANMVGPDMQRAAARLKKAVAQLVDPKESPTF